MPAGTTWSWLVLEAAEASPEISVFAQYGVLGVFALMLVVFARTAYKRETDRSDRLEQEVLRLNAAIQERFIPTLLSATSAVEESTALLRDLQREREWDQTRRRRADGGA